MNEKNEIEKTCGDPLKHSTCKKSISPLWPNSRRINCCLWW